MEERGIVYEKEGGILCLKQYFGWGFLQVFVIRITNWLNSCFKLVETKLLKITRCPHYSWNRIKDSWEKKKGFKKRQVGNRTQVFLSFFAGEIIKSSAEALPLSYLSRFEKSSNSTQTMKPYFLKLIDSLYSLSWEVNVDRHMEEN